MLWKSSVHSQYHPLRPSYIPPKQNLSLFAGSFLPCPGEQLSERVTGGGTLFRSRFSNFLSALGRVFQIFYPLKVPFLNFYPLSRSQFFHSVSTQELKIRYRIHSGMSKMRFCVCSRALGGLFNCCTSLR